MNRFQAIGPKAFGAGRPWPVEAMPARMRGGGVVHDGLRPRHRVIRSTRCFGTPS